MSPAPKKENHFCSRCGSRGPFRGPSALKCLVCDGETEAARTEYQRDYQRSKSAALKTLIERHQDEFSELLFSERVKLERLRARERSAWGKAG